MTITVLLISASCEKSQNEPAPDPPQNIIDKSLAYFDGEVIEKSQDTEDGVKVWEVRIRNSSGAVMKFYWRVGDGSLYEMEGETGPYDYEVIVGNNLINFQAAFTFAKAAVKNDNLLDWHLKQEDRFIDKWVYTFEFDRNSTNVKVYIDASNGDVLEIS